MGPLYEKKAPDTDAQEDPAATLGFCKWFQSLEPAPKGTIRIFDRADFYTVYGHDALFVAKEVYRTHTVLKWIGPRSLVFDSSKPNNPSGIPSCSLSRAAAVTFLRECLTARQLRVQLLSPESNASAKVATKWAVTRQASPGNLEPLADLLFASSDILSAPVIASIWVRGSAASANGRTIGVAFADTSVRTLGMSEFVEREEGWANTESLMIQLGVKEVVIPVVPPTKDGEAGDVVTGEYAQLRDVLETCGIVVTERKKTEFSNKNSEQDLNRLLKGDLQLSARPEFDFKAALTAVNPLLIYLGLLSDSSNFGSYKLVTHDLAQYMRLDASAVRALHLFPDTTALGGGSAAAKSMSIFGVLNRCKTSQGTRLLGRWLKQPLVNLHQIQNRQELVQVFINDALMRQTMRDDFLRTMPDLTRISKRFAKGAASLEDVVRVYQAVVRLPDMIQALERTDLGEDAGKADRERLLKEIYLSEMEGCSGELAKLCEMVETTIDLDELSSHRFVIKADFDEELQELQAGLVKNRDELDEEHARVAADLGMEVSGKTPLHFENHQVWMHVFRLTRKEAGILRNRKGYIELSNRNNGTHFTTKLLKDLNQEQKDLTNKYERKQSSLVKEVIAIAASYCPTLERLNEVLAHLDVIANFAHVALNAPTAYVRPTVREKGEGDIRLVESRHPCLEVQEDITFIPNDVNMRRGESEMIILSGPNMGDT